MCALMTYTTDCNVYIQHFISLKLIKGRNTKFYTQYQTWMHSSRFSKKSEKTEVEQRRPDMRPEVNILKTARTIFFIFYKQTLFYMSFRVCQLFTAEKFVEVHIWYPNFRFRKYVSQKSTPNQYSNQSIFKYIILFQMSSDKYSFTTEKLMGVQI